MTEKNNEKTKQVKENKFSNHAVKNVKDTSVTT